MADTFWRLKRQGKIIQQSKNMARRKERAASFGRRLSQNAKTAGMMTTNMAADDIRSRGVDRVRNAFDRFYFNIDREGRDVKNKPKKKHEGTMEEVQLDEFYGAVARALGRRAATRAASRAGGQIARQAAKKTAQTASEKVATNAAGTIARRNASKVAKATVQHAPPQYIQKRTGKGIAAWSRKKSHRINALMRKKRMLRSKEMRMKPGTAMAKQAARTAAADTGMRTVVDIGSHVMSTPVKAAYDKAAGTPERHSTKFQAQKRQEAQQKFRSHTKQSQGERLTASYHEAATTLLEKVGQNANAKAKTKFGSHSLDNAKVALHRSQEFKPMNIKNNPSGPTRTNTRSRQNSDVNALDNIIGEAARTISEMVGVGVGYAVRKVMMPQINAARKVGTAIGNKIVNKKPLKSDVNIGDNVYEVAPFLAVAGGTVAGTIGAELAMKGAKKGYEKYKQVRQKSQANIRQYRQGLKSAVLNRRASAMAPSMSEEVRQEIIQEILATTAIGGAALGGLAARRLIKRNPINQKIYAKKAARLEKKAKSYERKADMDIARRNIRSKGRAFTKSARSALLTPGRNVRRKLKIRGMERQAKRLEKRAGMYEAAQMLAPYAAQASVAMVSKAGKKAGEAIASPIIKRAGRNPSSSYTGKHVSDRWHNWQSKRHQAKAEKLHTKAAKARATSDVFKGRVERSAAKKAMKLRDKIAKKRMKYGM